MDSREVIMADETETLDIELSKDLLDENRRLAAQLRKTFDENSITVIDVMGSIGAGKTSLIEAAVDRLISKYRIAVIAGDVATTIDADRVLKHGAKTVQINTGKECHLDANMIGKAIEKTDLNQLDIIFIENVGNLICPADYPLGAQKRVVVISVTEGPYMVVKHPLIFKEANILAINKIDLAEIMRVDVETLVNEAKTLNPRIEVVRTSAREKIGLDDLVNILNL